MTPNALTTAVNLGFLTVVREPAGYIGGYLVTNHWGRPLEFRLSTPVQPNRVQQILYAETLEPYICGELIGKTLVEKTTVLVRAVVTDTPAALDLRQRLETALALLAAPRLESPSAPNAKRPELTIRGHDRFPSDGPVIQELLDRVNEGFDLVEPFQRIREAMAEARKMGVANRG